ncbi:MAG: protein translocase subunit SecF [Elusimicrobia bacterium]|nr:protein translocase subunit SecF [Elusimicrobiota bacterium]
MIELFKRPHIDFIGLRWIPISASVIIMFGGLAVIAVKGFNYSIEFTGGALEQVTFPKPVSLADVRQALEAKKLAPEIQTIEGRNSFILREKGMEESVKSLGDEMEAVLKAAFPDNQPTVDRREYIGPVIGKDLQRKTYWAIVLSVLGITIYLGFRFANPIWGLAALIALFHDVIGTAALVSITGKEMDLLIVSALLTIAGFSIEDTIIIYDRMREMGRIMRRESLAEVIDTALNDTLTRTVITVLLVQIICVVLWLAGGQVLHNFALCLVVGNILGTYSSIGVAAPLVYEYDLRYGRSRPQAAPAGGKPAGAPAPGPNAPQGKKGRR